MRPAPDFSTPTHPAVSGAASIAHSDCTVIRHKRITHSTMNILTGEMTAHGTEERVELCRAPLFTDHERATGTCRSCAKGWEAEGNRFATPAEIETYTRNRAHPSAQ